ncbi:UNKNOWN [Stylonychia lemnae]|uniref:Uncharacterized protein n=1 Tax=Stylonychia lemnae TaxID=5949 RepID=A0A078AJF5_STYLE|nr:UNKNOWN [Stylonychia lemnae]|eukprot:CDW82475.1 UNKNOWN [Stylonychia lemnae]
MLTESKLKSNYIGKQVNNELFQDDFLQQVVNDVYWNSYDPAQDDPQVQSKDDQESIPPLNEEEVQYLMRENLKCLQCLMTPLIMMCMYVHSTDQFQMESVMNMILKLMNDHQETDCNNHQQQSINDSLKISITKSANMINMLSDDSQEVYQNNTAVDNMQDGYYNPMNPQAMTTQNIELNSKVALNVNCQCCGYFDFYEIDSCY